MREVEIKSLLAELIELRSDYATLEQLARNVVKAHKFQGHAIAGSQEMTDLAKHLEARK